MKNNLIIKLTFALFSFICYNTDTVFTLQYPDKIKYLGIEYSLDEETNPFEEYFNKNPQKRPKSYTTTLWRGYIGYFETIEGQLFITDITRPNPKHELTEDKKSQITFFEEIFPKKDKVKIEWYNDILFFAKDNHTNNGKDYFLLEIKKGVVTKSKNLTYSELSQFKERLLIEFRKTNDYNIRFENLKNNFPDKDEEFIKTYIKNHILKYINEFLTD